LGGETASAIRRWWRQDIVEQAKEVEQKVEHVVEEKLVEVTHRAEERVEKAEEKKDAEIKRLV